MAFPFLARPFLAGRVWKKTGRLHYHTSTRTACKGGFTLAPPVRQHLLLLDHPLPYPSRLCCGCLSSESVSRIDLDNQSVLLVPFEPKSVVSLVPKIV